MRRLLPAATVFLVALCLRPAITAVGPLLPRISADEGLGEAAQGLLGALPLLAFAFVSPQVHRVAGRFGVERAVLAALLVLAAWRWVCCRRRRVRRPAGQRGPRL